MKYCRHVGFVAMYLKVQVICKNKHLMDFNVAVSDWLKQGVFDPISSKVFAHSSSSSQKEVILD